MQDIFLKTNFSKSPLTYIEQVELLKERGMLIEAEDNAAFYLQHLNYYRLSAYWLPFKEHYESNTFKKKTRFADVMNLYIFDRELRLLTLDAIERIEVSARAQWAHQLACHHGAHALENKTLVKDENKWKELCDKLEMELQKRSNETFIKHFQEKYKERFPPVWVACEIMTIGTFSKWYKNLKPGATRRAISAVYGMDEGMFEIWLYHITVIRNTCAHHSRLWNYEFKRFKAPIPKNKPSGLAKQCNPNSQKIYNTLVILLHCMDIIAPNHTWRDRLINLIAVHNIPTDRMGFPKEWKSFNIWRNKTS